MRPLVQTFTSGMRPFLILTALCAALFMPGLSAVPPTDRDEARFMQATKQMLETGDVVNIRFQDEPRTKKPVGIHWLQVLSVKAFAGGGLLATWAYRLPSAAAAWLTVLCTFVLGRRLFDAKTGLIAAGLTACTVLVVVEAHLAKTDAVLLLTVVLAEMALAEFCLARSGKIPTFRTTLLLWAAIGAGLLIKGPITLAVIAATIIALCLADRNVQWLRGLQPEVGIPVAVAFILPWTLAATVAGNGDVILASLVEDFLPKLFGGEQGHGAPPGSHLLASPATLWPASLLLLPGLVLAWKRRSEPNIRFLLAWAGATWIMFEVVPTKLPHYILPAVPAIALAAAAGLSKTGFTAPRWSTAIWTATALLLAAGLTWAAWTYNGSVIIAGVLAIALIIGASLVWTPHLSKHGVIPVTAVVVFGMVFMGLLPSLSDLALSTRLAESVERHGGGPVALSRYHEPSTVFLLGTGTWLTNARNAAGHIAADPAALAAVAQDDLEPVAETVAALQGTVVVVERIKGYNYAKGRPETLVLIRSEPDPEKP